MENYSMDRERMFFESAYLRCLLNFRQINFSVLRNNRSVSKNGCEAFIFTILNDHYLLKSQLHRQVRYFKICHSLKKDAGYSPTEEIKNVKKSQKKKRKNDVKIIVTKENGNISSMFLSEAEKYAKHNNLNLVKLDDSNYRFEKEKYEFLKKKAEKDNSKKFLVRDSIADHDLEIKINSMLKYIEKYEVLCAVENVNDKLNEVSTKIINSPLKDFLIRENKSSKRIILVFKKKINIALKNAESSKENEFSETTKKNKSVTSNN